jgi:pullulanase
MLPNNQLFHAYQDELDVFTIFLPYDYFQGKSSSFQLKTEAAIYDLKIVERTELERCRKYRCQSPMVPEFGKMHYILDERGQETLLLIGNVVRTKEFDQMFFYGGKDLGAHYSKQRTVFKIWSPIAIDAVVHIKKRGAVNWEAFPLIREEQGIFSAEVKGDWEQSYYYYHVLINGEWRKAADPYAKAVSLNSEYSCVVDLGKTKVKRVSPPPLGSSANAILYETSVRDLTIHPDSGVKSKGKYLGAAEKNTRAKTGGITGLSYIKTLGVTHIEFLPFFDFYGIPDEKPEEAYNWGYNPLFYNVPEGSFASDPENPYNRIVELKQMIETIHSEGMRVIMDVVYNHVYDRESSPFDQLVPGYYFRFDESGRPANGSGVGNDFASERRMARKFILDSIEYWLKEFNVDGFRFDLMGILDVETMNEAVRVARSYKSDCLMIGEGWDLPTPLARHQKAALHNQHLLSKIGQFNDFFRDTIKGGVFDLLDKGYALGRRDVYEKVFQAICGTIPLEGQPGIFTEPVQAVNFVECHDNHTLWDKLNSCFPGEEKANRRRHLLATSMVLLSQGIPFLHSGQEFFRTKKGIGNSYNSKDDVNWIDWPRKEENMDAVNYIKGLIAIRKHHKAFRLQTAEEIQKHMKKWKLSEEAVAVLLDDVGEKGPWNKILIVFHPNEESGELTLPGEDAWNVIADENKAGIQPIREVEQTLELSPISCYVCVQ